MKTKSKILNILISSNEFVSGEVIAKKLSVSRVAVKKAVDKLRNEGYAITSVTNKGYFLEKNQGINKDIIKSYLTSDIDVIVLDKTESTNLDAKNLAESGKTCVVIALTQTGGKGRMDRKFHSPSGGVYLSVIIRPNLPIASGVKITTFSAVAVRRAILNLCGLDLKIKWVNDLFLNGKKVCGILTEASCDFEQNLLKYAVVGIGINVDTEVFPSEISSIATSLYNESKIKVDKNKLIAQIINCLLSAEKEINDGKYLDEYRKNCFILGKLVTVYSGSDVYDAIAVDINSNGSLTVNKNGQNIVVSSGEVSVKLK